MKSLHMRRRSSVSTCDKVVALTRVGAPTPIVDGELSLFHPFLVRRAVLPSLPCLLCLFSFFSRRTRVRPRTRAAT